MAQLQIMPHHALVCSRVQVTLQSALSVGWSVGRSVGWSVGWSVGRSLFTFFIRFISLGHFKSF